MRISELPLTQENIIKITEYKEEDKMEKIEDIYTNAQPFVESELAEDLKAMLKGNLDTKCSKELRHKINGFDDDDILEVTMKVGGPVKIMKVELIGDDYFKDVYENKSDGGKRKIEQISVNDEEGIGDFILNKNKTIEGDLIVHGNIIGNHDLTVKGNIKAHTIITRFLNAKDIDAKDIIAVDIKVNKIEYSGVCVSYNNISCQRIIGLHSSSGAVCLGGRIIIRDD